MKNKLILLIFTTVFIVGANAQNWKTGGNNASIGQWLGTSNPVAFPIKTNGVERINVGLGIVNITGVLSINNIPVTPSFIDSISLSSNKRRLLSWKNGVSTIKAYVIPFDASNNAFQGLNGVVTNGINNYLGGDWVIINGGSGSFVFMNHGYCEANGALMAGADGFTYEGADYSNNLGDANHVYGLAATALGFGNTVWDSKGFVGGNECELGTPNIPNAHYSTFAYGNKVKLDGVCSMGMGGMFKTVGEHIMTFGYACNSPNQECIITTPNTINIINNSIEPTFTVWPASGAGTHSPIQMRGELNLTNIQEFADNESAVAALGDSGNVYYTTVGTEQFLKRTHPVSNFNIAPPQNDNTAEQVTREEALRMQGTWSDALGRRAFDLSTGLYILQQGTFSKIVYIK